MERRQLFEFNDLPAVPAPIRDTVVESLSRMLAWGRVLEGLVPVFEDFLERAGTREVLDLGSGAGGPASILVREFKKRGAAPPRVLLTDLHPRVPVWESLRADPSLDGAVDFVAAPVDATAVAPDLARGRVRTVINVLHHFPPSLAQKVLLDAAHEGAGVFVAEGFDRSPLGFLPMTVTGLPALLLNPVLSPHDRLAKAALTWLTPAALAIGAWDGIVSTLRIHDEDDLRRMVAPLGDRYAWTFGRYPFPFGGRGTYFYGLPKG
jgi:hypothetical protein